MQFSKITPELLKIIELITFHLELQFLIRLTLLSGN